MRRRARGRRRILLVMGEARGGIREHVLCLAKFADRGRFAVSVCGPPDTWFASELRQVGVEFISAPGGFSARSIAGVRKVLAEGFELVHGHGYRATWSVSLGGWPDTSRPQICTIHTLVAEDAFRGLRGWLKRRAASWALGRCRAVVAVSKAVATNIGRHFPQVSDRVRIIYNGVDAAQIRPATMRGFLASSLGFDPNMPLIGVVARLSPEKGVHVLLEAAGLLENAGVAAQYVIVGDGPQRAALEGMVHQLGLTGQVRFTGERRDVSQLISLFDVLVVPSLSEAFSLVALVGGILGVPVIASRNGGIEEVLGEELAAFVPPGDARSLAEAVLRVLQRDQRRSGPLAALGEEVATSGERSFFLERAEAGSLFAAHDISGEALPYLDLDDSLQGQARRELLKRFDARRMAEETTSLYESVLG